MPTLIDHEPTISSSPEAAETNAAVTEMGGLATAEVLADDRQELEVRQISDAMLCATTAPPELYEFSNDSTKRPALLPDALDHIGDTYKPTATLEDGTEEYRFDFFAAAESEFGPASPDAPPVKMDELIVRISPNGDVRFGNNLPFDTLAVEKPHLLKTPGAKAMMEQLGYLFEGDNIFSPSPETFKRHCEKLGIDVALFPDQAKLKAREYNGSWKAKKYPVGSARIHLYLHDIGDDHVTALVIGGSKLREYIAQGIKNLEKTLAPEDISPLIDSFSATYRTVIAVSPSPATYQPSEARNMLYTPAKQLGLTTEQTDELIEIGLAKASELGLDVNTID